MRFSPIRNSPLEQGYRLQSTFTDSERSQLIIRQDAGDNKQLSQDLLGKFNELRWRHNMKGSRSHWAPRTDFKGIGTQTKLESLVTRIQKILDASIYVPHSTWIRFCKENCRREAERKARLAPFLVGQGQAKAKAKTKTSFSLFAVLLALTIEAIGVEIIVLPAA